MEKYKYTSSFVCVTTVSVSVRFDFVVRRNFAKQKSGSYRVYTPFLHLMHARWYFSHARVSTRSVSLAIYKMHISIAILRRGQSCIAVTNNSYRKLIQDNYRNEMLKHINCWRMYHGSLHLSHCTIPRCVVHANHWCSPCNFHKCCKYFTSTIIVLSYPDTFAFNLIDRKTRGSYRA